MPEVILRPLALQDLRRLARGEPPRCAAAPGPEGALPPPFVAQRSLRQHAAGVPWRWCSTFLVLRRADRAIVGGCGFKDAPRDGRVEIGYGIAAACRGRGHAQQAVRALLRRAFRSGEVEQVLAHVAPDNLPSTRVVQALGFRRGALLVDEQGETLVEWVATPATREARAGRGCGARSAAACRAGDNLGDFPWHGFARTLAASRHKTVDRRAPYAGALTSPHP